MSPELFEILETSKIAVIGPGYVGLLFAVEFGRHRLKGRKIIDTCAVWK